MLTGISVINGAQTTGSIGSVDINKYDMKNVKVLCRIIKCTDADTISEIVKYNNTQNEITTWDQYSNDAEQNRIFEEFGQLGLSYSRKRGFRSGPELVGIEDVARPCWLSTASFKTRPAVRTSYLKGSPYTGTLSRARKQRTSFSRTPWAEQSTSGESN
ncbi:MAG: AIPR family protein [Acidobacteriia bacterium]|nr:AIPR family protein [Terriglobia bacterium]